MTQHSKLGVALWEAGRHVSALADALYEWRARAPTAPEQIEADRLVLRSVDQILFRFANLVSVVVAADELIVSFRDWQGKLPTVPFPT